MGMAANNAPVCDTRLELVARAKALLGKPYIWDAKGPDSFDCSGFVCFLYEQLGLVQKGYRLFHNAHSLWNSLPSVVTPAPGDLAFYGRNGGISHVMMHTEGGQVIGASGGDSTTIKPTPGKEVKIQPSFRYRSDYQGSRESPIFGLKPKSTITNV